MGEQLRNVSLIFVHNHRFEGNLARLDAMYGERFQHIQHLVPFYQGTAKNVIPVYETSRLFENYFAQGQRQFIREGCTHYIFCADDMILNPRLNENNICSELGLDEDSGFIKFFRALTDTPFSWPHTTRAMAALVQVSGANWKAELPSEEEALKRISRHGIKSGSVSLRRLDWRTRPGQVWGFLKYLIIRVSSGAHSWREIAHLPYPMLCGYSDLIIVPANAIAEFCHYCGAFSAAKIFVEVAAPTALALSCKRVVCERSVKWKGIENWREDVQAFCESNNYSLKNLFENFPPGRLYVHPIKLSKWK